MPCFPALTLPATSSSIVATPFPERSFSPHPDPGTLSPVPQLLLLGGTALRGIPAEDANRVLAQSKVVGLLAYLALSPPGRYQRRDRLVGLLWPELDQEHARAALRKAIYVLRTALGHDALLSRGDEEIVLAPNALKCDAVEFIAEAEAGHLEHALELHRGELLAGFHLSECAEFGQWIDEQRGVVQRQSAAASWAFAARLEHDGNLTTAGQWARRAVEYAGSDERVLRKAIAMLARLGDRAGALKVYEGFARRMDRDYGAKPSRETQDLIESLRT